ncbi:MAG: hypothetical protein J6I98_02555, partial [Clostridia bacterium]|nr:hypothetical protein [Clostridia bacterium]
MAQEEPFQFRKIFEERRKTCMMKKRRIIAAILILAFAFAFMTMTASAVEARANCSGCGAPLTSSNLKTTTKKVIVSASEATNC